MIKLQKGQKISLTKDNPGLSKIAVGLGWDENKGLGGFFKSNGNIDCDATAYLLRNGKLSSRNTTADEVSYRHRKAEKDCVRHSGDNLTGAGDGDDETIYVDLDNVPEDVDADGVHSQSLAHLNSVFPVLARDSRIVNLSRVNNKWLTIEQKCVLTSGESTFLLCVSRHATHHHSCKQHCRKELDFFSVHNRKI